MVGFADAARIQGWQMLKNFISEQGFVVFEMLDTWNLQRSSSDTSVGNYENLSLHEKKVEANEYLPKYFCCN